jgi:ubiquinone/menaquinone biosynthesis C-methylase UbiE
MGEGIFTNRLRLSSVVDELLRERMDTEAVRRHYNSVAKDYKSVGMFLERITSKLSISESMCVLDVGCGAGDLTFEIAKVFRPGELIGIDVSESQIELARSELAKTGHPNMEFQRGDASRLPFDDECFDVVTSNMVLHLFPDPREALFEMYRVLKRSGKIVIHFAGQRPTEGMYHSFLEASWSEVFERTPFPQLFNIVEVGDIDEWLRELDPSGSVTSWIHNRVHVSKSQCADFKQSYGIVSGLWRDGLADDEILRVEKALSRKIAEYYELHEEMTIGGNTILLEIHK